MHLLWRFRPRANFGGASASARVVNAHEQTDVVVRLLVNNQDHRERHQHEPDYLTRPEGLTEDKA